MGRGTCGMAGCELREMHSCARPCFVCPLCVTHACTIRPFTVHSRMCIQRGQYPCHLCPASRGSQPGQPHSQRCLPAASLPRLSESRCPPGPSSGRASSERARGAPRRCSAAGTPRAGAGGGSRRCGLTPGSAQAGQVGRQGQGRANGLWLSISKYHRPPATSLLLQLLQIRYLRACGLQGHACSAAKIQTQQQV